VHDGSAEVVACFPQSEVSGSAKTGRPATRGDYDKPDHLFGAIGKHQGALHNDTGSAARFFAAVPADADDAEARRLIYCAKASKADRDEGLEGFEARDVHRYGAGIGEGIDPNAPARNRNTHSTVKATRLMRVLARLITPPGGIVLDPFTGSGSTGKACMVEGFRFVGIEQNAEYLEIARARIEAAILPLFRDEPLPTPQPAAPKAVQARLFEEL
jgi:site-specific DNA-methyltransferase (adenine-specific)